MTEAICMKCGHSKIGAFTKCKCCDFEPDSEMDKNISLHLTDWLLSNAELEDIGNRIKDGAKVRFGEEEE